jgi:uncharacterized membrane-anchored protein
VALGNSVQTSNDLELKNNSNVMTFEDRLRLLEEALMANVVTEGNSVEDRLAQLERTLLAANTRVGHIESKLRRATVALVKDAASEDGNGGFVL